MTKTANRNFLKLKAEAGRRAQINGRNNAFYDILRNYQDGNERGNGVLVGRLDIPLSAVYDKLVAAADAVSDVKSSYTLGKRKKKP